MNSKHYGLVGIACVLLLAAGAFGALRWIGEGKGGASPLFGEGEKIGLNRAAELPETEPDVVGILVRLEDNSLFLGTGNVKFHAIREDDSQPLRFEKGYDGPVLEVVVTHNTVVYFDSTDLSQPLVDGKVQQIVRTGALDEMGENHLIQAWGDQQGDRLVARLVLIISPPKIN